MDIDAVLANRKRARAAIVDPTCRHAQYRDFVAFLEARPPAAYEVTHYFRYCQTFANMLNAYGPIQDRTVVETGTLCPIALFLREAGNRVEETASDLRLSVDKPDGFADVMLSFEVLEHLKDRPETSLREAMEFNRTGAATYARELRRALKPGGALFLTTPNPRSATAVAQIIAGRAPMIFAGHVREYVAAEIRALFAGFAVEVEATQDVFFINAQGEAAARRFLVAQGASAGSLGDDHFFLLRAPT